MRSFGEVMFLLLVVFSLNGCNKNAETNTIPLIPPPGPVFEGRDTYSASDSSDVLWVNLSDSLVEIHSYTLANDFTLPRVPSASGVKYQSSDGFFFWTKGNEFLWGQHDSIWFQGYKQNNPSHEQEDSPSEHFYGHYVSDGYDLRDQGYDWVAVSVHPMNQHRARVSVRSRADKKKPTCTFDGLATITNDSTLVIHHDNLSISFHFSQDSLMVGADTKEQEDRLYFFCSGGASLAGSYVKIDTAPDQQQADNRAYFNSLGWESMFFQIMVQHDTLTIVPRGLEIDNRPVVHKIDATVYHSEIGDLNQDGFPEVLIYLKSEDNGSYGSVIGYSVNNGKSMSQVYLPPVTDSPDLSMGYMGYDEFAIVESTLVQRFPIYQVEGANSNPTGSIRQIQYKLMDGEAMRRFEVERMVEY